jgi:hypothetical protein
MRHAPPGTWGVPGNLSLLPIAGAFLWLMPLLLSVISVCWAFRPVARKWFEFPKYKILEDDKRFSQFDDDRDRRKGENLATRRP